MVQKGPLCAEDNRVRGNMKRSEERKKEVKSGFVRFLGGLTINSETRKKRESMTQSCFVPGRRYLHVFLS